MTPAGMRQPDGQTRLESIYNPAARKSATIGSAEVYSLSALGGSHVDFENDSAALIAIQIPGIIA